MRYMYSVKLGGSFVGLSFCHPWYSLQICTEATLMPCYDVSFSVFIACQHAYACRARYCYGKSVRRSVRHTMVLYRNESTIVNFFPPSGTDMTSFLSLPTLQNFKGNSLSGSDKYIGMGKICDFRDKSPFISETVQDRPIITTEH